MMQSYTKFLAFFSVLLLFCMCVCASATNARTCVTGENMHNTFCPGRGANQDLLRGSQTLYRVAIKAGLYRKAVQVCIIPNITTYSPSILDSSANLN